MPEDAGVADAAEGEADSAEDLAGSGGVAAADRAVRMRERPTGKKCSSAWR
jgi:hypothetical protein